MPHYYLHVCNGTGFIEDESGQELADDDRARAEAIDSARSIMSDELRRGELDLTSFIEVEDEAGTLLFTVSFEEAVKMRRQHEGERPPSPRASH